VHGNVAAGIEVGFNKVNSSLQVNHRRRRAVSNRRVMQEKTAEVGVAQAGQRKLSERHYDVHPHVVKR
jgi:hypothetical protein